jgi:hypothetical protein
MMNGNWYGKLLISRILFYIYPVNTVKSHSAYNNHIKYFYAIKENTLINNSQYV